MPGTIWCFAFASLALIGIPPTRRFISKWYLAAGALDLQAKGVLPGFQVGGFLLGVRSDSGVFAAGCDEKVFGGRLQLQECQFQKR